MTHGRESWYDEEAGPLVRPYAITRGRTRADRYQLNMITLMLAVKPGIPAMAPEYGEILRLCHRPLSVAEVAASLDLPLAVLKVLAGDLIDEGYLIYRTPQQQNDKDVNTLQAVLDGIRKL
jgi:hypothetical protein